MKKKISLKMWLSVFFGGIWQFIRNIFSWKNKTPFWRVIWGIADDSSLGNEVRIIMLVNIK